MMNTTVFVGASVTLGAGLPREKNDPDLWVNRLHGFIPELSSTALINLANGGTSNEAIFYDAVDSLASSPKYLFVAWTSFPRLRINPSVELYETGQIWTAGSELADINFLNLNYSKKYLTDIKNRFLDLLHDHYEIIKVLKYSQTITKLSKLINTKVFFINATLPWDDNYFIKLPHTLPSATTRYTQSILDADSRDDAEYWGIYDKIHSDYAAVGLPDARWINLYQSYQPNFVTDLGTDNQHPGPLSNLAFSEFLIKKITF